MLPYINDNNMKFINSNKKKGKISDIKPDYDWTKLEKGLEQDEIADLKGVMNYLPSLKVTADVFVDGETEIVDGDIITVKVTVDRSNLKDDQYSGPIHSPNFPMSKYEKLWLIIAEPELNKVLYLKSFFNNQKINEDAEFKIPLGPNGFNIGPGKKSWALYVKSDSYYGLDVELKLDFEVKKPTEVQREEFKIHPEDENIEKNATWMQSVMAGLHPDEESSEDEEMPELEEIAQDKEEEEDEDFELLDS